MKVVTSECQIEFIYGGICKGRRLDGRTLFEGRDIEIVFGKEDGSCTVIQGNTRALAIVTCELVSPNPSRPSEGMLYINLDLSPMASLNAKSNRSSDDINESVRILETCMRDSKCIDLESLCIVAGLKVWCIRVNIQVLNDDGNYIECASIAGISALAHFKRPNVTVIGTDITVHSIEDQNPISLTLHHMPVIVNLCIFDEGCLVIDPLEIEERIALGKIIVGVNAHQEICSWHHCGEMILSRETVINCMTVAVRRAQTTTQIIRSALDADKYKRLTNQPTGFVSLMQTSTILGARYFLPQPEVLQEEIKVGDEIEAQMLQQREQEASELETNHMESPVKGKVRKFLKKGEQIALFEGGESSWKIKNNKDYGESEDEEEESYIKQEYEEEDSYIKTEEGMEEGEIEYERKPTVKTEEDSEVVTLSDSGDSEEENKHFLKAREINIKDEKAAAVRGWYSKNPFK